jgi:hypothetical protein
VRGRGEHLGDHLRIEHGAARGDGDQLLDELAGRLMRSLSR